MGPAEQRTVTPKLLVKHTATQNSLVCCSEQIALETALLSCTDIALSELQISIGVIIVTISIAADITNTQVDI